MAASISFPLLFVRVILIEIRLEFGLPLSDFKLESFDYSTMVKLFRARKI